MELNYKVFGEGQPLIILHGLLGSLDNWQTLARQFAEQGFKVFTVDIRNHGRSPHTASHSYSEIVDDLLEFYEQQNLTKASIIGHSMGGKAVMQFTSENPDKVDKLIVVDIAPKKYSRGHDSIFKAMFDLPLEEIKSRGQANKAMEDSLPDFGVRQFILKNLDREDGKYVWKPNLEILYRDYDYVSGAVVSTSQVEVPTLVIKGELSGYITKEDEAEFANHFNPVAIISIPKAGHWVHAEAPKLFFEAVLDFLA